MSWNFSLILFVLLVVTGLVWLADVTRLRARRAQRADALRLRYEQALVKDPHNAEFLRTQAEKARNAPWWIEYALSFFPVILIVFSLRSFVIEPFRIPSGSMLPTLEAGDLIVVNKFSYGVRLPIVNTKVIANGSPQRGDVVVFRYPVDPQIDYIKRVVGLPGDEIAYLDKRLMINGQPVLSQRASDYFEPDRAAYTAQYSETLGDSVHRILLDPGQFNPIGPMWRYPARENCQYLRNGLRCTVPAGHYFVMGDNRDNSLDSRYWGFVPDENIVGKAFFIWMNFGNLRRVGSFD